MRPPRIDEAIGYFRTAAALRPDSPGAILNVGHALQIADRTDEAIAAYEQAIRLKPDYAMAYSNLGVALSDAGRLDEAIVTLRKAIRLMPGRSYTRSKLTAAYYRKAVARLQAIQEFLNEHVVRISGQRHFLQPLLDPRNPPMLRRCFVLNLLASGLLAATAHAQTGPGTIYYRYGSTSPYPV
jgi:tetratricopeptide (TPR) repeat protein